MFVPVLNSFMLPLCYYDGSPADSTYHTLGHFLRASLVDGDYYHLPEARPGNRFYSGDPTV